MSALYSQTTPLIVDHRVSTLSTFESIPAAYITAAKTNLHIAYEHTSHGQQLVEGMTGLVNWKGSTYAFNTGGTGGALDLRDHAIAKLFSCWGMDLGNTRCPDNEQYYLWATNTRTYLATNPGVNVVIWSWCGQLSYATDANVDQYLSLMNQLEIDYPNITFIYMTGHVDQWQKAPTGRVYLNNQRIRNFCIANNKILFDFADIESYDPDGNYYADKYLGDDGCYDANGNGKTETNGGDPALPINGDKSWMLDYQASHTLNVDWFQCAAAHSYPINSNLKAYAAWYLWARLAGWSGTNAVIPTVTSTTTASSITQTSAISGGTITSDGGAPILARGVCWDQAGYPALDNVHTEDGTGTGTFTSNITGLNPNTKYYVKSYATNSVGTAYGPRMEFTTLPVLVVPTVTTSSISTITQTGAVAGGNVTSDGGSAVLERGVCWSTSTNPTTSNNKATSGTGTGTFTIGITGLTPNTTYYVRSYARNAVGTSYGSNVSFKTQAIIPVAPYYISTSGNDDTGDGTITKPWFSINKAWSYVKAGETIYVRGGTYQINEEQHLYSKSGTSTNPIRILAYQSEKPFISPSTSFAGYVGVEVENVNYLHIKGIEIANFVQRTPTDWYNGIKAYNVNNCIFELINVHHNGFGFSIGGQSTGNLVLNSDFHHNYDPITAITTNEPYGGSDGLTIRVPDPNSVNIIRGCRMWNNSDDGFDGWYNAGMLIFEDCWSFNNGYREDGVTEGGDGNGFKMGPMVAPPWTGYETQHKRTMTNCIAFNNRMNGFDQNATLAIMYFYNCDAFGNGNHGFLMNNDPSIYMIARNNISYKNAKGQAYFNAISAVDHNTFTYNNGTNPLYSVTDADFISIDPTGADGPRQADGSLPNINFLKLVQGSDLINRGVDVGLPYNGSYPDLGAFESNYSPILPNITTKIMTEVTENTATTGGIVTADGGSPITAKGVCWSVSPSPTLSNAFTDEGPGAGEFTSNLTGLTPNTLYYVRAYATNAVGTAYGEEVSFTSLKELFVPTVSTTVVTDITETTAVSGGNVTFDGNTEVTARGICWNTSPLPTTDNNIIYSGAGVGVFTSSMTGLTPNTTYYVRAFAINSKGTSYGEEVIFTTLKKLELPVVITASVTNITQTSAVSGGNVTFDGFDNVTARGVVWDTSPDPTTEGNKTLNGNGTGTFTSSISGLKAGAYYYLRSYAENSVGIAYGDQKTFKTLDASNYLLIYPNPLPISQYKFAVEVKGPNFYSTKVQVFTSNGILKYTKKMNCWLRNFFEGHDRNKAIVNKWLAKLGTGTYNIKVLNKYGDSLSGTIRIA